jgi:hypothetical protein
MSALTNHGFHNEQAMVYRYSLQSNRAPYAAPSRRDGVMREE